MSDDASSSTETSAPFEAPATGEAVVVTCHVDGVEVARTLLDSLVAERYAACGHVGSAEPARYWWQGEMVSDTEFTLRLVTSTRRLGDLVGALAEAHPYEVPDITWSTVATTPAYASWVGSETTDDQRA